MQTSAEIGELAKALAQAQGEFTNPERNREVSVKTRTGGSYNFRYATLDSIIEMARPILSKHGLSIVQPARFTENTLIVTTAILHASGQSLNEEISLSLPPNIDADGRSHPIGPQELGSAMTYLKRYQYCGMLGIAAEEDDDGNAASGNHAEAIQRPACPKCGKTSSVIVGKPEFGGGYACWMKREGCGHAWNPENEAVKTDETSKIKAEKVKKLTAAEKRAAATPIPPPVASDPPSKAIDPLAMSRNRLDLCSNFSHFRQQFTLEIANFDNPKDDLALRQHAVRWIEKFAGKLTKPEHCDVVKDWLRANIPNANDRDVGICAVDLRERELTFLPEPV